MKKIFLVLIIFFVFFSGVQTKEKIKIRFNKYCPCSFNKTFDQKALKEIFQFDDCPCKVDKTTRKKIDVDGCIYKGGKVIKCNG